ncbi:MAG: M28 family peptidase [Caldilineaceae bacterium]|nr:M28 family peptidase [Caldilineaceae bacterium]MCB9138726.1 M28 family peptidase [Caldilineaceae bacterium]
MKFFRAYSIEFLLMFALLAAVLFFAYLGYGLLSPQLAIAEFSGEDALAYAAAQVDAGPRATGSEASAEMVEWLTEELRGHRWRVIIQPYDVTVPAVGAGEPISDTAQMSEEMTAAAIQFSLSDMVTLRARNVIAYREPADTAEGEELPVALIVAPYDSRIIADADQSSGSTPGANIGASSAAVLLELADTLNIELSEHRICLVFLDGEHNRGVPGWQPPYGGSLFLQEANDDDEDLAECARPRLAVVLDGVGGTNHRLRQSPASDLELSRALWRTAAGLELDAQFVEGEDPPLAGVHNTFVEAGIPTVLLAEGEYPYRYTSEDTLDKLDAASLSGVGTTLKVWLESGAPRAEE